jgi:uncharacterized protein YkwD
MSAGKKIFYSLLIILALGGIIFRAQVEDLFFASKERLADFTSFGLDQAITDLETIVSAPPPLKSEKESPSPILTQSGTIRWTNINRRNHGLPDLKENKKLDEAAMKKAKDILEKQYFDHVSPSGKGPQDLAEDVKYDYITIGENLAMGNFANDQELLEAWMESPGHRENILRQGFSQIGVAVIEGKYENKKTWVAVQEFGTPLADCSQPDRKTKQAIEAGSKKIEELARSLQAEKDEISKLRSRDPALSERIDGYNARVLQYEALAAKTKKQVEAYNKQVADFNSCIKKYKR